MNPQIKTVHTASLAPYPLHPKPEGAVLDYGMLKAEVLKLTGINLEFYKENQMRRRIDTLVVRWGAPDYPEFLQQLKDHPDKLEFFRHYITINVTEFFRDAAHWQQLEESIFPALIKRFGPNLTLWSVASSTGEEPYSLALCLSRLLPLENIHIIATDVDHQVLQTAQKGWYNSTAVEGIPADLLERFFLPKDGGYQASDELRRCIEFRNLDLHQDAYPQGMHLIVCRNVLIYFTTEAKDLIFDKFRQCGAPGSCLFLGKTEQIVNWKKLGYLREKPCFYFQ